MGKTLEEHELSSQNALGIELSGGKFFLPWEHVGNDSDGVWIAKYDPRRRGLCEAGAKELVRMATPFDTTLIVAAESKKSGGMVQMVRDMLQEVRGESIDIVTFAKMELDDVDKSENAGAIAYCRQYSPITAGGKRIAMVASPEDVQMLRTHAVSGRPVIMDDVISTGDTERTARYLIDCACQDLLGVSLTLHVPTIAVMRECLVGNDGKMQESHNPNYYYAVRTPVVPGSSMQIPQGYTSEPFLDRVYSEDERAYLMQIAQNDNADPSKRFDARLALAGMVDWPYQGLMNGIYNTWH